MFFRFKSVVRATLPRVSLILIALTGSIRSAADAAPRYVFFFLGDGMATVQIQAAEAYVTVRNGGTHDLADNMLDKDNWLGFRRFQSHGSATTFAGNRLITGSAAAATAFACGTKTGIGFIAMTDAPDYQPLKSLAHLAREQGRKIGVVSSVSIDHATPAAYYASVYARDNYRTIAVQLAASGYNFFAGGGFREPVDGEEPDHEGVAHYPYSEYLGVDFDAANPATVDQVLERAGYARLRTRREIMALQKQARDQVICTAPWLQNSGAMPYRLDQDNVEADQVVTLAEFTEVAIASLQDDPEGFFLMVEGGKIDWACHANDAMAAIADTLAFDQAVAVAVDFYRQHPDDTLIVVTGDHECGGMTIGYANTGYDTAFNMLRKQTVSFQFFDDEIWKPYAETHADTPDVDEDFRNIMLKYFGLDYDGLDAFEKKRLEAAFDKALRDVSSNPSEEDTRLYRAYNPVSVTLTHLLNERAGVAWTSFSHTGVPVPVFALGRGSDRFAGFYDNTDIARKMGEIMGVGPLPVSR